MKHLFFAHSHTLTLCSLGTIEYLGLNHKDCIFLCVRNYKIPEGLTDCKIIDANYVFNNFHRNYNGSLLENRKDVKQFDKYLKDWTDNSRFNFYTPHLYGGIYILIASYRKCRKVSFVQEGAYTIQGYFINHIDINEKIHRWFLSFKNYGSFRSYLCSGWYTDGCLPFQHKIDLYATSSSYFMYMPTEKCVFHKISMPVCNNRHLSIEHIEYPIFVFDGYVKNGIVEKDYYLMSCKRLISEFCSTRNYIKFHPAQSDEERSCIISYFEELGVKQEMFPDDTPFEFYIAKCKNLRLIGFSSSLLFFAKDAGHTVIARTSWLLDSPTFKTEVEKGYCVFDNN